MVLYKIVVVSSCLIFHLYVPLREIDALFFVIFPMISTLELWIRVNNWKSEDKTSQFCLGMRYFLCLPNLSYACFNLYNQY